MVMASLELPLGALNSCKTYPFTMCACHIHAYHSISWNFNLVLLFLCGIVPCIPIKFVFWFQHIVHQFAPFIWSQGFQSVSICARVCFLIILCRRPIDQRYFMLKVMTKLVTWTRGNCLSKHTPTNSPPNKRTITSCQEYIKRASSQTKGFSSTNRVSVDSSIIIRILYIGMEGVFVQQLSASQPPCQQDTLGKTCFKCDIQVSALLFPCLIGLMVGASLLGCSEMSMLSPAEQS